MTEYEHGDKAFYCEVSNRYLLGRTPEGDCPFCGEDLTGERYEKMQERIEEHREDG